MDPTHPDFTAEQQRLYDAFKNNPNKQITLLYRRSNAYAPVPIPDEAGLKRLLDALNDMPTEETP